jgi:hypothetical protein
MQIAKQFKLGFGSSVSHSRKGREADKRRVYTCACSSPGGSFVVVVVARARERAHAG